MREPSPGAAPAPTDAVTVVSAYGAFRLLLALLAVWSFFAGFSLLTGGLGQLGFGGDDNAAERVVGAHMLILAPVYGLLAWRRQEYRLLLWIPYAAQLAIILPGFWELLFGDFDGALLLIVSIIFFALLVYVWMSSHPLGFFEPAPDDGIDEDAGDEGEEDEAEAAGAAFTRSRRYRRSE
jgi:hypothetical protein